MRQPQPTFVQFIVSSLWRKPKYQHLIIASFLIVVVFFVMHSMKNDRNSPFSNMRKSEAHKAPPPNEPQKLEINKPIDKVSAPRKDEKLEKLKTPEELGKVPSAMNILDMTKKDENIKELEKTLGSDGETASMDDLENLEKMQRAANIENIGKSIGFKPEDFRKVVSDNDKLAKLQLNGQRNSDFGEIQNEQIKPMKNSPFEQQMDAHEPKKSLENNRFDQMKSMKHNQFEQQADLPHDQMKSAKKSQFEQDQEDPLYAMKKQKMDLEPEDPLKPKKRVSPDQFQTEDSLTSATLKEGSRNKFEGLKKSHDSLGLDEGYLVPVKVNKKYHVIDQEEDETPVRSKPRRQQENKKKLNKNEERYLAESKKCYALKKPDGLVLLDDVMNSPPKPDKGIFFHDTTCFENGRITFTMRQACAVESAAKWNPNREIYVLFAAPAGFRSNVPVDGFVSALKSYPNINFRNVNWYNYAIGTLAEQWIRQDIILMSQHHISHLSDFLRFTSLYKFGGVHFDMDFIVQQSLDDLPVNFAGAERTDSVNVAVLGLQSKGTGHKIAEMALREHAEHYKGDDWAWNGPGAMTRTMQKICQTKDTREMTPEACWDFKVYPIKTFYPIHHLNTSLFFNPNDDVIDYTLDRVKNSPAIHLFNSNSKWLKNKYADNSALKILAESNCPQVLAAIPIGDNF